MRAWGFLPPSRITIGGWNINIYAKVQAYRGRVWGGSHRGEEYQLAANLVQVQSYGGVEFLIFPAPEHNFPAPTAQTYHFALRLRCPNIFLSGAYGAD